MPVAVLLPCPASQHQMAATFNVARPLANQFFINQLVSRSDQHRVGREIIFFSYHIKWRAEGFGYLKVAKHMPPGVPQRSLPLLIYVPEIFVIPQNRCPPRK